MGANRSKSPQSSPCRPAAHGQHEASVGAVWKSQTGAGRVACHPTVALRLREALLYYYTILDPGLLNPFISPIYPDIIVLGLVLCLPLLQLPPTVAVDQLSFHTTHSTTLSKPQHTVKMKYQLIALPALAATVAAQDLYVRFRDPIAFQRLATDIHSQQLHPRRASDCPPQLSRR